VKETVVGLVIRTAPYGENGKLLTLLTAEGKRTVSVSGARGIKSRFVLMSQLLCYGEYTLDVKGGRAHVGDVALIENFYELFSDPLKLSLASYACEIAEQVCVEDSDEGEMLQLLLNVLYVLTTRDLPLPLIKAVFEARVLHAQGIAPTPNGCRGCGEVGEMTYLDVMDGSIVCPDCLLREEEAGARASEDEARQGKILLAMEESVRQSLSYLLSCPPKRIFAHRPSEEDIPRLGKLTETYLQNHLECHSRSLSLYREMLMMEQGGRGGKEGT